jgi:hypothetical protein
MLLSLADFTGRLWVIRREIDDRRAGGAGLFLGSAVLRPEGDGLRYHEVGRLRRWVASAWVTVPC